MRSVSQLYKDAIKSLGRELYVRVTTGEAVYTDISNLNYYTENDPFKSSMSCLTLSIKGTDSIEGSVIDSCEIGVKVTVQIDAEGEFAQYFEYADYGAFYITEKEYSVETDALQLTCYDNMYYSMKAYSGVDSDSTEIITVQDAFIMVCNDCGFSYDNNIALPNGNIRFKKSLLNDCSTYRDILDAVAGIACVNIKCEGKTLKIVDWTDTDAVITPSEMKKLKIGDKVTAPDVVDFVGVISTVRLPQDADDSENKITCDNNPIILGLVDSEDVTSLYKIFERLQEIEYYTYETDTIGFTYFEPGDKLSVRDTKNNEYPIVIMDINLTINQGMTETFKAEMPSFAANDYSVEESLNAFVVKDHIMQKTFTRKDGVTATIKFGYVSGSSNANYIHMIDVGGGEYPYCVTDEGIVECLKVISQQMPEYPTYILWYGAWYMNESQTITFRYGGTAAGEDAYLSDMANGIVLVFSRYSDGEAVDGTFSFHFIPKDYVRYHPGGGCNFLLASEMFSVVGNKYLYITNTGIMGKDSNTSTGTAASGIKYTNNAFVLRYVIGI